MSLLQSDKLASQRMWCRDGRPAIAAMSGPLVFIFLLAQGLRGKAFTKEASLYQSRVGKDQIGPLRVKSRKARSEHIPS